MSTLPLVITAQGLQPQTPASLLQQLLASVAIMAPGYTALPGSLIEDVSSTEVAGIALIDQARVEFFNSLTPYTANPFILNQIGVQMGVLPQLATNTSVYVVFSGTPGQLISPSFIVSDGTYLYVVQDGGVVASDGSSAPLFAVATQTGAWAVPAGTVTQLNTNLPTGVTLTVTNPQDGIPAAAAETEEAYRTRVLQAQLAAAQGMPSFMKTLLNEVQGVQSRLISVQQGVGGFKVICGGGDQYEIAAAIFYSDFDISRLVGSTLEVTGITNANPGVMTTNLNHGFATGQVINVTGVVGMSGINGTPLTITVLSENSFSLGIDTTSSGTYTSGGVVTPNLRNIVVSLSDAPDTYEIRFVNPPQQSVQVAITWNTLSTNFVSPVAMAQAVQPAIAAYINAISVGQPINLFEMQATFQAATAALVPTALLTRLIFVVSINGITTSPESGTGIIAGDPESFFYAAQTDITVTQG